MKAQDYINVVLNQFFYDNLLENGRALNFQTEQLKNQATEQ